MLGRLPPANSDPLALALRVRRRGGLPLHARPVQRVAPVQQRVENQADGERREGGPEEPVPEGDGVGLVAHRGASLGVLVAGELRQEGHHHVAEDGGGQALEGRVPGHDRAAALGGHDFAEDGPVDARGAPHRGQPEEGHEEAVGDEHVRAGLEGAEHQPDDRDAGGHRDLRDEGATVDGPAHRSTVADEAAQEMADGTRAPLQRGDESGVEVGEAGRLEEHRHAAQCAPEAHAEQPLQDDDDEGRRAEEADEAARLLGGGGADLREAPPAVSVRGPLRRGALLRRLHHGEAHEQGQGHRDQAHGGEGDPPAVDAQDDAGRDRRDEEGGQHRADVHGELDLAEDLPSLGLRDHVRDQAVGDGPEARQEDAVQRAQRHHEGPGVEDGQQDGGDAPAQATHGEDRAARQDPPVGEDAPDRRGAAAGDPRPHVQQGDLGQA
mmetsp:Transcript_1736/g.4908  ORF Transcript_1736/g.4908 Transcript_1736/m.4908 type:complete len:438 (-) Transcript_1736:324-1637(-)